MFLQLNVKQNDTPYLFLNDWRTRQEKMLFCCNSTGNAELKCITCIRCSAGKILKQCNWSGQCSGASLGWNFLLGAETDQAPAPLVARQPSASQGRPIVAASPEALVVTQLMGPTATRPNWSGVAHPPAPTGVALIKHAHESGNEAGTVMAVPNCFGPRCLCLAHISVYSLGSGLTADQESDGPSGNNSSDFHAFFVLNIGF